MRVAGPQQGEGAWALSSGLAWARNLIEGNAPSDLHVVTLRILGDLFPGEQASTDATPAIGPSAAANEESAPEAPKLGARPEQTSRIQGEQFHSGAGKVGAWLTSGGAWSSNRVDSQPLRARKRVSVRPANKAASRLGCLRGLPENAATRRQSCSRGRGSAVVSASARHCWGAGIRDFRQPAEAIVSGATIGRRGES